MKTIVEKINTSEFEINKAQELWAQNVIEIGNLYIKNEDYKKKASVFVKQFYAFDISEVLFKPTLASEKQFRYTYDDALSYFIGGHISEDTGFALKPWQKNNDAGRTRRYLIKAAMMGGILRLSPENLIGPTGRRMDQSKGFDR